MTLTQPTLAHERTSQFFEGVRRRRREIVTPEVREAGTRLRAALAAYREKEDLISIGAYQPGTDPLLDSAIGLRPRMDAFLRQGLRAGQSQPLTGRANDRSTVLNPQIHVSRSPSLLFEITCILQNPAGRDP